MASSPAAQAMGSARRLVVKIGSALLVDWETGSVNRRRLAGLAADIAALRADGRRVAVVSSGAVALGRRRLDLPGRALALEQKQAAAAAGQALLMRAWEEALEPHGLKTAQILLTRDDTETRRRFLNARGTLSTLMDLGAVPVINENDSVATEEIRYGDNDLLAARAAQMAGADLLVLLSDIDGLYSADPRRDPAAEHIALVERLTPEIEAMAGGANLDSGTGTGGMASKIQAVRIAAGAGCAVVIARGSDGERPLSAVRNGGRATLFQPALTAHAAYKSWIGGSLNPTGELVVDAGCARALEAGKSLLAVGLKATTGAFAKGDAVVIRDEAGRELGRGLSRYDRPDAERIRGLKSAEVEAALGYDAGPVVHADDLALG